MINAIHVTHEAIHKVGGIGTVLEGLINSRPYRDGIARTVLVGPLFDASAGERLGPGGVVEYSTLDGESDGPYAEAFQRIEQDFGVRLIYGRRPLEDGPTRRRTLCEVLLVDLRGIHLDRVNELKGRLWSAYGIRSDLYEHIWEFEQYVRLAAPAVAALEAMRLGTPEQPAVAFGHEFMGVPTVLALQMYCPNRYRTLFYAHEVAPVRRIVEARPGHDVMFYNALRTAREQALQLDQVFGPQHDYHKYALVEATHHCDGLLAVGHHVQQELLFLGSEFDTADVTLCYNGIPNSRTTLADRAASRQRVGAYLRCLLGWEPDYIFTHVTRLARSKALWRDVDVLLALDDRLAEQGRRAVLLCLATEVARRPTGDILRMEREWDWPLAHREGHPDLTGGETQYYRFVQSLNARARNVRIVFINQFGFDRASCGLRVPEDVEFSDLRRASDLEFGLSLYEPFGISPLEPLTYGGLCLTSTSCGCAGFVKQAARGRRTPNVILANYIDGVRRPRTIKDSLAIDGEQRREVEGRLAQQLADEVLKRLPADDADRERLLKSGQELARRMSWDEVAERFVFPAIQRAAARRRRLSVVA